VPVIAERAGRGFAGLDSGSWSYINYLSSYNQGTTSLHLANRPKITTTSLYLSLHISSSDEACELAPFRLPAHSS
jgi:hypothetical protein